MLHYVHIPTVSLTMQIWKWDGGERLECWRLNDSHLNNDSPFYLPPQRTSVYARAEIRERKTTPRWRKKKNILIILKENRTAACGTGWRVSLTNTLWGNTAGMCKHVKSDSFLVQRSEGGCSSEEKKYSSANGNVLLNW